MSRVADYWQPNGLVANLVRALLGELNKQGHRSITINGERFTRQDLAAIADTGRPLLRDAEGNLYRCTLRVHMSGTTSPKPEWTFPAVCLNFGDHKTVQVPPFKSRIGGQAFSHWEEVERVEAEP